MLQSQVYEEVFYAYASHQYSLFVLADQCLPIDYVFLLLSHVNFPLYRCQSRQRNRD